MQLAVSSRFPRRSGVGMSSFDGQVPDMYQLLRDHAVRGGLHLKAFGPWTSHPHPRPESRGRHILFLGGNITFECSLKLQGVCFVLFYIISRPSLSLGCLFLRLRPRWPSKTSAALNGYGAGYKVSADGKPHEECGRVAKSSS